jgi:hypothetical protein
MGWWRTTGTAWCQVTAPSPPSAVLLHCLGIWRESPPLPGTRSSLGPRRHCRERDFLPPCAPQNTWTPVPVHQSCVATVRDEITSWPVSPLPRTRSSPSARASEPPWTPARIHPLHVVADHEEARQRVRHQHAVVDGKQISVTSILMYALLKIRRSKVLLTILSVCKLKS